MKRYLILLLLPAFLLGACQQQEKTTEEEGIFPYTIEQDSLDNGLQLVTIPYNSPGLASFYIIVGVGSREEVEPGKTGFAHFFEHMMFRGTDQYSPEKYREALKKIGASANANTWLDRTVYHMTGNAEKLDKMFEVEADRFQNLNYPESDFRVEAGAVKGEYTKNFASQYRQIDELLRDTAFDRHTYKHTTMGFFEDIKAMPDQFEYSKEFYDRFYRPEYTTILVTGDANAKKVKQLAGEYFGDWERGNHRADIPEEPEQQETRYAHIQNANFTPMLVLNYKSPAFDAANKEVAALDILATLLFSERSDLYQQLVNEEQKVFNLSEFYLFTKDPYLFQISATLPDENDLQYVKNTIIDAMDELKNTPIDSTLLAQTKSRNKYQLLMRLDDPQNIAEAMSYFIWVADNPKALDQYYATLMSVTAEDIAQTAQKYFAPERLTIATISSKEKGGVQ